MLKITVLTCAIITLPPVFQAAVSGDPALPAFGPGTSPARTGRFVDVAGVPGGEAGDGHKAQAMTDDDDRDVVGSIQPGAAFDPYVARVLGRGTQDAGLCAAPPAHEEGAAGQDLACGGAERNRWSLRVEHFNYDLSAADMSGIDAFLPYSESPAEP